MQYHLEAPPGNQYRLHFHVVKTNFRLIEEWHFPILYPFFNFFGKKNAFEIDQIARVLSLYDIASLF